MGKWGKKYINKGKVEDEWIRMGESNREKGGKIKFGEVFYIVNTMQRG